MDMVIPSLAYTPPMTPGSQTPSPCAEEFASTVGVSSSTLQMSPAEVDELRRFTSELAQLPPDGCEHDAEGSRCCPPSSQPVMLSPAPQEARKARLMRKLSTTVLGGKRDKRHGSEAPHFEPELVACPLTPARSRTSKERPATPTKPRMRFGLFSRGAPPPTPSPLPPTYRDVELRESWAKIGIDIDSPNFGPRPHCTPHEWASALDDFFGGGPVSTSPESRGPPAKHRSDGWL